MFSRDGIVLPEDLHMARPGLSTWWITVWFNEEESRLRDQDLLTLMLNRIHDEVADIRTDNLHHTHMWCISIPVFVKAPAGSNAILFYVEGLAS
jgi:hypothetical protein